MSRGTMHRGRGDPARDSATDVHEPFAYVVVPTPCSSSWGPSSKSGTAWIKQSMVRNEQRRRNRTPGGVVLLTLATRHDGHGCVRSIGARSRFGPDQSPRRRSLALARLRLVRSDNGSPPFKGFDIGRERPKVPRSGFDDNLRTSERMEGKERSSAPYPPVGCDAV